MNINGIYIYLSNSYSYDMDVRPDGRDADVIDQRFWIWWQRIFRQSHILFVVSFRTDILRIKWCPPNLTIDISILGS